MVGEKLDTLSVGSQKKHNTVNWMSYLSFFIFLLLIKETCIRHVKMNESTVFTLTLYLLCSKQLMLPYAWKIKLRYETCLKVEHIKSPFWIWLQGLDYTFKVVLFKFKTKLSDPGWSGTLFLIHLTCYK